MGIWKESGTGLMEGALLVCRPVMGREMTEAFFPGCWSLLMCLLHKM